MFIMYKKHTNISEYKYLILEFIILIYISIYRVCVCVYTPSFIHDKHPGR